MTLGFAANSSQSRSFAFVAPIEGLPQTLARRTRFHPAMNTTKVRILKRDACSLSYFACHSRA